MFFRSLRFKISLWQMVVLLFVLALFSMIVYSYFSRHLPDNERVLANLRFILIVLVPVIAFFTGITGALLARLSLKSVDTIVSIVGRITADNLKLRVVIPDSRDEIKRLADMCNNMLEKLDTAFSAQQRFLQDLSHELKIPLTVMQGELDVTLKKKRSAEEYEAVLRSGLEEIIRIGRLVDNLLVLARLDNRELESEWRILSLAEVVGRAVEDIRLLAEHKGVVLECITADAARIYGDEFQLYRLFFNLLDNAIKYTESGGAVSAEVEERKEMALVRIGDSGIGIAATDLPHIFERFYRAGNSTQFQGLGLGLSIARSVAESHGGQIAVQSQPGRGTQFTVCLPYKKAGIGQ